MQLVKLFFVLCTVVISSQRRKQLTKKKTRVDDQLNYECEGNPEDGDAKNLKCKEYPKTASDKAPEKILIFIDAGSSGTRFYPEARLKCKVKDDSFKGDAWRGKKTTLKYLFTMKTDAKGKQDGGFDDQKAELFKTNFLKQLDLTLKYCQISTDIATEINIVLQSTAGSRMDLVYNVQNEDDFKKFFNQQIQGEQDADQKVITKGLKHLIEEAYSTASKKVKSNIVMNTISGRQEGLFSWLSVLENIIKTGTGLNTQFKKITTGDELKTLADKLVYYEMGGASSQVVFTLPKEFSTKKCLDAFTADTKVGKSSSRRLRKIQKTFSKGLVNFNSWNLCWQISTKIEVVLLKLKCETGFESYPIGNVFSQSFLGTGSDQLRKFVYRKYIVKQGVETIYDENLNFDAENVPVEPPAALSPMKNYADAKSAWERAYSGQWSQDQKTQLWSQSDKNKEVWLDVSSQKIPMKPQFQFVNCVLKQKQTDPKLQYTDAIINAKAVSAAIRNTVQPNPKKNVWMYKDFSEYEAIPGSKQQFDKDGKVSKTQDDEVCQAKRGIADTGCYAMASLTPVLRALGLNEEKPLVFVQDDVDVGLGFHFYYDSVVQPEIGQGEAYNILDASIQESQDAQIDSTDKHILKNVVKIGNTKRLNKKFNKKTF